MFSRKPNRKAMAKISAPAFMPDFTPLKPLKTTAVDASVTDIATWSQVRRCHRCDAIHEAKGHRVLRCGSCGAHFAPFFFAELTPDALIQSKTTKPQPEALVLSSAKNYRAIVGLTWWWDETPQDSGELVMPRA